MRTPRSIQGARVPVDGSAAFWGLELVWAEMRNLETSLHSSLPASSVASSVAGSSDEFNNSDTNGGCAAQEAGGAHRVREEREQYDSFMHHQVLHQLLLHVMPRGRWLTCVFGVLFLLALRVRADRFH